MSSIFKHADSVRGNAELTGLQVKPDSVENRFNYAWRRLKHISVRNPQFQESSGLVPSFLADVHCDVIFVKITNYPTSISEIF